MANFGRRSGDMFKSDYDTNDNSVVDNSSKLAGSTKTEVQNHTPKTHTHEEEDITDLDHDAQKIKGVIINDAAIADGKVLSYDSGTSRIVYITPAAGGAAIEKIQYGVVLIEDNNASGTATITSVDITKSACFWLGKSTNEYYNDDISCRISLTNATTVTANRIGTDQPVYVSFVVLEFSSGINSIQQSTVTIVDGEEVGTQTITSVDITKTLLIFQGYTHTYTDQLHVYALTRITLTNATTITATRYYNVLESVVGFTALEFSS